MADNSALPPTPRSPPEIGTAHSFALPTAGPQCQVSPTRDAAEKLIDWLQSSGHTIVRVEVRRFGEFAVTWR
jgi:hypothetical protein